MRKWFRELLESSGAPHVLHYLERSDDICKAQLKIRNSALPPEGRFTTKAEFDAITAYLQPPVPDEHFNVARSAPDNPVDR
jgi:hypothetical protein